MVGEKKASQEAKKWKGESCNLGRVEQNVVLFWNFVHPWALRVERLDTRNNFLEVFFVVVVENVNRSLQRRRFCREY